MYRPHVRPEPEDQELEPELAGMEARQRNNSPSNANVATGDALHEQNRRKERSPQFTAMTADPGKRRIRRIEPRGLFEMPKPRDDVAALRKRDAGNGMGLLVRRFECEELGGVLRSAGVT